MCAALVLLHQPFVERLEVVDHRLRVERTPRRPLQDFLPRAARARSHKALQEVADAGAAVVVGIVRILLQDLPRNVVVQLEQERLGERVVVVLSRVVVDVGLGYGVGELFAAAPRWHDALIAPLQVPPSGVEHLGRKLVGVQSPLEPRHHTGSPGNEHDVVQGLLEELLDLVHFGVRRREPPVHQELPLGGGKADHRADGLVVCPVGAVTQHERHVGVAVGHEVIDVPQLVVHRLVPIGVGLHAHQRADVGVHVHVPRRGVSVLLVVGAGLERVER